ncbi:hypothetical protein BH11BAC5_BH11BAC5_40800 [soil metagenome]
MKVLPYANVRISVVKGVEYNYFMPPDLFVLTNFLLTSDLNVQLQMHKKKISIKAFNQSI